MEIILILTALGLWLLIGLAKAAAIVLPPYPEEWETEEEWLKRISHDR